MAPPFLNFRRKVIAWLFLLAFFICFIAASAGYYLHWIVFAISMGMWLIIDFMFFDDNQFLFEPNYR